MLELTFQHIDIVYVIRKEINYCLSSLMKILKDFIYLAGTLVSIRDFVHSFSTRLSSASRSDASAEAFAIPQSLGIAIKFFSRHNYLARRWHRRRFFRYRRNVGSLVEW